MSQSQYVEAVKARENEFFRQIKEKDHNEVLLRQRIAELEAALRDFIAIWEWAKLPSDVEQGLVQTHITRLKNLLPK